MKKTLALLLLAITMAAVTFAQGDPLTVSQQRKFQNNYIPTYSTGGYKLLVKNNTTGIEEATSVGVNTLSIKTLSGTSAITADTTQTQVNSNKLRIGSSATAPFIRSGTGTPLFVVSAPVGSVYLRTNGVVDSTLYFKSVGVDSAGWYPAHH